MLFVVSITRSIYNCVLWLIKLSCLLIWLNLNIWPLFVLAEKQLSSSCTSIFEALSIVSDCSMFTVFHVCILVINNFPMTSGCWLCFFSNSVGSSKMYEIRPGNVQHLFIYFLYLLSLFSVGRDFRVRVQSRIIGTQLKHINWNKNEYIHENLTIHCII